MIRVVSRAGRGGVTATTLALALSLAPVTTPGPATADPRVHVACRPSGLTVRASGAPVGAVVAEIGKCVGFSVAEILPDTDAAEVSFADIGLDEALERLLAAKNYTVIYRDPESRDPGTRAAVIDRIVLLGPRSRPAPEVEAAATAALSDTAPATAAAAPVPTIEPDSHATTVFDPSTAGGEVATMLATHAISGVASPPATAPPSTAVPADVEAALALTAQQAQQQVRALVEALETATRSLSPQTRTSAP